MTPTAPTSRADRGHPWPGCRRARAAIEAVGRRIRRRARSAPLTRSLGIALLLSCGAAPLTAQTGLLVVAHGANAGWNQRVREAVAQVTWAEGPVATAYLMGAEAKTAGWTASVARLIRSGAREIVVVPLMVSSAGAHVRQIRFYAGEIGGLPPELASHAHGAPDRPPVPTRVTAALDDAPELGAIVGDIWTTLAPDDRRRSVFFVAHGPSSDAEAAVWVTNLARAIGPVAATAGVPFGIGLLRDDAPPPVRKAAVGRMRQQISRLAESTAASVTVIPILVSRGSITTATIPRDLAGLPIRYVPASLAPSPHLARWIERQALAPVTATH